MKIIDLYNIIAKGEVPPKQINYDGSIYNWDLNKYLHYSDEFSRERNLLEGIVTEMCLNDEVEIIEDKPKKIENMGLFDLTIKDEENELGYTGVADTIETVYCKLDEIIDSVNYLLEKSDKI